MTRGYAAPIEITKCGNPEAVALVLLTMEALDLPLPERLPEADLELRRFSSDGAVVVRHGTSLQSVDIVGQMIGHIANVIRSSDPEGAVELIGMSELKARLQRRSID